jgi:hypothetical protein
MDASIHLNQKDDTDAIVRPVTNPRRAASDQLHAGSLMARSITQNSTRTFQTGGPLPCRRFGSTVRRARIPNGVALGCGAARCAIPNLTGDSRPGQRVVHQVVGRGQPIVVVADGPGQLEYQNRPMDVSDRRGGEPGPVKMLMFVAPFMVIVMIV